MAAETATPRRRLEGWDAIADYIGVTTRTAREREKRSGMPVHRVPGGTKARVYAYQDELDAWFEGPSPKRSSRRTRIAGVAIPLFLIAITIGMFNSIGALFLDERFGHYRDHRTATVLLVDAIREQFGPRQRTVWWRFRAMFWKRSQKQWGDMERTGVANLSR